MRQVVSYEDITLPYELTANAATEVTKLNANYSNNNASKRKRKSRRNSSKDMDMSRELTHEEIWDDSVLIDAWNAAAEEYEAYHGPDKGWKSEPVHKSPLWYNVPPAKKVKLSDGQGVEATDSCPIDFDTFVPDHDPGLSKQTRPDALPPMVSRDEAFSQALNAMYWSGYWTAVYHCHNYIGPDGDNPDEEEEGGEDDEIEDAGGSPSSPAVEDELVPTQR